MARGYKTDARTSGTPNRKTQAVIDRLEALAGDPSPQMSKELAQYVAFKRKAVKMHADFGQSYLEVLKAVNAKAKRGV